jgi:methylamine--corrinoid protein Co-methyltransferase
MSIEGLLRTLDKAHSGPVCTVKEWNMKVIPRLTQQKLKEHGLQKAFDSNNPINTDDGLADEFYKAGFELAIEMGVICQETERVIKVSEEELLEGIRSAPSELVLGYGEDRVVVRPRRPEDKLKPLMIAPTAVAFSEDMYIKFTQAVAQYREIDIMEGASLTTLFGRPVLAGTPYETLLGRYEAELKKEALWRAGRPGMPTLGVSSSPTEYGQFGGFGTVGGLDPSFNLALILLPGEMMTHYPALHKIAHTINCGGKISMGLDHMIGGYSGPPEGAALTEVANWLLQFPLHQAHAINVAGAGGKDNGRTVSRPRP